MFNECLVKTYSYLGIFLGYFIQWLIQILQFFQLREKFSVELCTVIRILPGYVAQVIKKYSTG